MSEASSPDSVRYLSLPGQSDIARLVAPFNDSSFIVGCTPGLVKTVQEDSVGCVWDAEHPYEQPMSLAIADAHWGEYASRLAIELWLNGDTHFPRTRQQAVNFTKEIEELVAEDWDPQHIDSERDRPTETSFIAARLSPAIGGISLLDIVSYGDCRLLIRRHGRGHKPYVLGTRPTWLGAFSVTGKRDRLTVRQGLIYGKTRLYPGDRLLLCTDGVPEPVYETPTISVEQLLGHLALGSAEASAYSIMHEVYRYGAEDNASLIIYQHPLSEAA